MPQPGILPFEHQVVRGQLTLNSDFDLPDQDRLIAELLSTRTYVCETLQLESCEEPIHIYLFSSESSYLNFLQLRFPDYLNRRAIFVETDVSLSVYTFWGNHVAEDLRHEVVHGYLHAAIPNIPLWLDEGLAEYFEVVRSREGLNEEHLKFLHQHAHASYDLARLEQLDSASSMVQLDYAESWAWVYYLLHADDARRQLLIDYLDQLQQGESTLSLQERLKTHLSTPAQTLQEYIELLR